MNHKQRQVIAEKIASTVRVLELLEFEYTVDGPERERKNGNRSPKVVSIDVGKRLRMKVYNGTSGSTWAHQPGGKPIPGLKSVEDLYDYLKKLPPRKKKA